MKSNNIQTYIHFTPCHTVLFSIKKAFKTTLKAFDIMTAEGEGFKPFPITCWYTFIYKVLFNYRSYNSQTSWPKIHYNDYWI